VNQDFARGVIFLSEQLDCSEKYCAELLNRVSTREPNLDLLRRLELAIEEHHEQRQTILNILNRLLESLSAWRQTGAAVEFDLLVRIAEQGLAFVQDGPLGEKLINKLLKETVVVKRQMDLVRGRLVNATSQTATGRTRHLHNNAF
jgi:nuclear pore complex protein Nup205